MKITDKDLELAKGNVEELITSINNYHIAVAGARNFCGDHDNKGIRDGLFRTGCALSGLVLVPYGNISNYPSWWRTYLDESVDPPERYWILPRNDFMKYI
ncbi:hypothetical protein [Xanthomonas virus PB119]|nr:hypothetical protein [Xanthomonas virus PB119]